MKKQILVLMMALFALSATHLFAQVPYLPPTPIDPDCIDIDNPLTPVPGRPYTYTVEVPSPDGAKTYHWYVTQDWDFIEDGVLNDDTAEPDDGTSPILASGSGHYDDGTNTLDNISLTWQSFSMNTYEYVFVVVYVVNDGTGFDGCVTDNLKVYRIQPLHAFTLTVASIDGELIHDETGGLLEICVDEVQSAIFDPNHGDHGGVVYDYGQNEFYYAVAAANFSGDFQLAASFEGLQAATPEGDQGQVATLYYGTSLAAVQAATEGGELITDSPIVIDMVTVPDGSYGEGADEGDDDAAFMFYIKVVVEHNQFEAFAGVTGSEIEDYEYILALDAVLAEGATGDIGDHNDGNEFGDQDNFATELDDCGRDPFGLHNQSAQLLLPRPTVESVPDGLLLPNAPE